MTRNALSLSHRIICMGALARVIGDTDLIRRADETTDLAVAALQGGVSTGAVLQTVDAITSEIARRAHLDRISHDRMREAVAAALREHNMPAPEAAGMALDAVRRMADGR